MEIELNENSSTKLVHLNTGGFKLTKTELGINGSTNYNKLAN